MRLDLDALLCARYPALFLDRHREDVPLSWGILCGDGWYDLVDVLCAEIQFATERNGAPQARINGIKEDLGGLVVSVRDTNEAQRGMIALAMGLSERICEQCGRPGQTLAHGGMLMTRCLEHAPDGAVPYSSARTASSQAGTGMYSAFDSR